MKQYNIFFFLFLPLLGWTQPGGELQSDEVEVINTFNATLQETNRVEIQPQLPEIVEGDKQLTYTVPDRRVKLEYLPPKLRPLGAKKQELEKGYNGFAKLGYGFPNSAYGELGYQYVNEEKFRIGGELMHHSANYKKRDNQRFSSTGGKIGGAYFLDNGNTVETHIDYQNNQVHFYGYNPEFFKYTRDQVQQHFNEFNFGGKFFNTVKNRQDLNYEGGLEFYNYTDNFASKENGVDLRIGATKWISEKHPLNVTLRTDFSTFSDGRKQDLNNFYLQPNFTFHAKKFKVKAGVNLASSNDNWYFFPDAEASVNVVGNSISIFAGATGDLYKNNMRSLSKYNPYLSTTGRLEIMNSGYYNYYGGVRGNLSTVSYEAQINYKEVGDLALFITDPFDSLRFQTIYDTTEIFTLKGSVSAKVGEQLDFTITAAQNIYKTQRENEAYGLPAFEANLGARYKMLDNKLLLKGDLFAESGIWIKDEDTLEDKLEGLIDVSLAAEYYFLENVGVFAQANNLLGRKRQRWFRYPTYGINILGGITARF